MYLFIYVCKWEQLTKLRRNLLLQSLVELLLLNLYLKYLKSHFIITLNFVLINRSYFTPHFTSFLFHSTICQSSTLQQQWPMQINCELHPHTHKHKHDYTMYCLLLHNSDVYTLKALHKRINYSKLQQGLSKAFRPATLHARPVPSNICSRASFEFWLLAIGPVFIPL